MTDAPRPKCGHGRSRPVQAQGATAPGCPACGHDQHAETPVAPPWAPESPESKARERKLLAATVLGGIIAVAAVVLFLR
ncbi:MAG: hypothetical protein M5U08_25980 [Burkholderiales bacterium]|nr:hypothetical protein [Burkholderiales bacterium]